MDWNNIQWYSSTTLSQLPAQGEEATLLNFIIPILFCSLHVSRQFLNICELLASTVLPLKEFQSRTIKQTKEIKEFSLPFVTCLMPVVSSFPDCHYYGKGQYLWYLLSTCEERTQKNKTALTVCNNKPLEEKDCEGWCSSNNLKNRPLFPGTELYPKNYSKQFKLVVVTVVSSRHCRALPAWALLRKSSHCHKCHSQRGTWIVSGSLSPFGSDGRQHDIHLTDESIKLLTFKGVTCILQYVFISSHLTRILYKCWNLCIQEKQNCSTYLHKKTSSNCIFQVNMAGN